MPQCLYLRFPCAKRAVCSGVPKFAAYFRVVIPEVRGKIEIGRPDPSFALPRPAVLLPKIGLCSEVFDFSPHFRKTRQHRASRSENRYEFRWKNDLLNAKNAYRRFPRTKPDVPSQGLITVGTLRKNPISVNPLPASCSEIRLNSNASVKLHVSRKTPATTSFPNRDVNFDRPNLTSKQKRGATHQPSSGVAQRLPPQLTLFQSISLACLRSRLSAKTSKPRRHKNRGCPPLGRNPLTKLWP